MGDGLHVLSPLPWREGIKGRGIPERGRYPEENILINTGFRPAPE